MATDVNFGHIDTSRWLIGIYSGSVYLNIQTLHVFVTKLAFKHIPLKTIEGEMVNKLTYSV